MIAWRDSIRLACVELGLLLLQEPLGRHPRAPLFGQDIVCVHSGLRCRWRRALPGRPLCANKVNSPLNARREFRGRPLRDLRLGVSMIWRAREDPMRNILIFVAFFVQFAGMALAESPVAGPTGHRSIATPICPAAISSRSSTPRSRPANRPVSPAPTAAPTPTIPSSVGLFPEIAASATTASYTGAFSAEIVRPRRRRCSRRAEAQAARLDFLYRDRHRRRRAPRPRPAARFPGRRLERRPDLADWAREAEADANLAVGDALHGRRHGALRCRRRLDRLCPALANAAAHGTEDDGDKRKLFRPALDASVAGYLRCGRRPAGARTR